MKINNFGLLVIIFIIIAGVLFFTYFGQTGGNKDKQIVLNGAGATFPYPLISKWTFEYGKIKPNVQINYQSIGSGGGIRQIMAKTVDFGASDAPLTEQEFNEIPGVLHIPITIGAVVIAYNLPGIENKLYLSGDVIANIYLGKITRWDDPKISSLNPDIKLPSTDIIVAHRSDGSGTTYIFTEYLSSVSDEWAEKVGKGKSVNWPVGLGGKGNEGVAGLITQNPHSIGYVELAYAKLQNIKYASIKNKAGKFTEPSVETIANSANTVLPKGDKSWSDVSIVNAEGGNSYPIASFSYVLVYKNQNDRTKGKSIAEFLWWAVHDGQGYSSELLYVPLPKEVITINEETIKLINYGGEKLITEK